MKKMQIFNYAVKNKKDNTIDIFIDGDIVDPYIQNWETLYEDESISESYKSFRNKIENSTADTYNIYINSGGGSVMEAMAIHDLIKDLQQQGKTVNTIGRGIVASAATYILMAAKNSTMTANSWLMIHNISSYAFGDVNQIENQAKAIRKLNDKIVNFYANATGKSSDEISELMNSETWMSAEEAKQNNFITTVAEAEKFSNKITPDNWMFKNNDVLAAYNSSVGSAAFNQQSFFNQFKKEFMDLFKNAFSQNKPAENATNEDIINAVQKAFEDADTKLEEAVNTAVEKALEEKEKEKAEHVAPEEENSEEKALEEKEKAELNEVKKELDEIKNQMTRLQGNASHSKGSSSVQFGNFEK